MKLKFFLIRNFIIPEYKIDLLNKSKKLINSIENINSINFKKKKKKKRLKKKIKLKKKNKKTKNKIKKN